ncbi:MAG: YneF family protein [Bacilli bacterium]
MGYYVMWALIGLVVGLVAGYFGARWLFKRELAKNPPVTEKMIRAMFLSMGRKPSEAQIKATIKSMNNAK